MSTWRVRDINAAQQKGQSRQVSQRRSSTSPISNRAGHTSRTSLQRTHSEPSARILRSNGNVSPSRRKATWGTSKLQSLSPPKLLKTMSFPIGCDVREETGSLVWDSVLNVPNAVPMRSSRASILESSILFRRGDRVMLKDGRSGTVRWIGLLTSKLPQHALSVGVQLDDPAGEHDGVYKGKRYFKCREYHGTVCRASDVTKYLHPRTCNWISCGEDRPVWSAKSPLGPIEVRNREIALLRNQLQDKSRKKLIIAQRQGERERHAEQKRIEEENAALLRRQEERDRLAKIEADRIAAELALAEKDSDAIDSDAPLETETEVNVEREAQSISGELGVSTAETSDQNDTRNMAN